MKMMMTMSMKVVGVAVAVAVLSEIKGATAMRCDSKAGQEAWVHLCDHPTCEYTYKDWCQLKEGEDPFPYKCIPKEDYHAFAEHCIKDDCDTSFAAFCTLNTGAAPTTTTTQSIPSSTAAPTTSTTTNRDSHDLCLSLVAKATIPGIDASCKDEVLMSHCASLHAGECQGDDTCVSDSLRAFVQTAGGTWEENASPSPAPSSSTSSTSSSSSAASSSSSSSASTSSPPGGPIDPDYIPFEHNITPRDLVTIVPWGVSNYMGKSEFAGAQLLHSQIVEAIRNGPPEFKKFCGTGDLEKDRRECAAFFANVCKETGGLGAFEEATGDTYCTHLGDGDEGLQSAGKDFPCCLQEDKTTVCTDMGNCPYGCRMHGRGAIQLTWNFNYGRFSEFYYGDKETLLRNPDMVEPQGPSGWAASIWFWMTPQDYGGACPPPTDFSFSMPQGTQSCHDAMHDPQGGGFGQTIRIINGGYEACPKSGAATGAIHRVRYYLFTATDWGVSPAEGCSVGQVDCDVSGVEFYTSSEGRIGNPQIGFKQNAEHCPNCGVPKCTDKRSNKWLCGGSGDETCQDPLENTLDPTCERDSSAPSAHPAPWE